MDSADTTTSCRFLARTILLAIVIFCAITPRAWVQDLPPGIRWSVPIPAAPSTPPLISGERVFVSTLPGRISAHDIKDGRELWRDTVNPDQPIVGDGERVFIAGNASVQAVQISDRAVAWRTSTGTATAPLVVKEGWVLVASAVRMLALRATDGSIVWQRETALQRDRGTIDGNTLFVPLTNGRLQAIDLANGATRWERAFGGVPAEPLVVGDRLYVGTSDKYFYCLKTSTGEEDWKFHVGASMRGRAATDGKRVFFVALDNLVRALGRDSGSLRWQQGVRFRPFEGPAVAGASVFVAGPTTEVRALQAATGKEAGKIPFPEPLVIAPAIGTAAGDVVVAGITGGLNESWKLWLASAVAPAKSSGTAER